MLISNNKNGEKVSKPPITAKIFFLSKPKDFCRQTILLSAGQGLRSDSEVES